MATSKNTPKGRGSSASAATSQLEQQIRDSLAKISLPENVFCEDGIAETTLDNARSLMLFLDVLDASKGDRMPVLPDYVMGSLRQMAVDAVSYAHSLVEAEDEIRGAARLARAEVVNV